MLSANAPLIPVQHLLHLAAAQRSHGSRFTVRFGTVLFFFNVFRARLPKSSCTGRDIVKVCQKLQQNDTKRTSTQFGCKASSNRKAFSGLLLRRFHELRGERQHLHPAHLLIVTS